MQNNIEVGDSVKVHDPLFTKRPTWGTVTDVSPVSGGVDVRFDDTSDLTDGGREDHADGDPIYFSRISGEIYDHKPQSGPVEVEDTVTPEPRSESVDVEEAEPSFREGDLVVAVNHEWPERNGVIGRVTEVQDAGAYPIYANMADREENATSPVEPSEIRHLKRGDVIWTGGWYFVGLDSLTDFAPVKVERDLFGIKSTGRLHLHDLERVHEYAGTGSTEVEDDSESEEDTAEPQGDGFFDDLGPENGSPHLREAFVDTHKASRLEDIYEMAYGERPDEQSVRTVAGMVRDDLSVSLSDLVKLSHDTAHAQGFWDEGQDNPAAKLALVHSEVSEILEELRKPSSDSRAEHGRALDLEIADVIIRLADLVGYWESQRVIPEYESVDRALAIKMTRNQERAYRHGKAF